MEHKEYNELQAEPLGGDFYVVLWCRSTRESGGGYVAGEPAPEYRDDYAVLGAHRPSGENWRLARPERDPETGEPLPALIGEHEDTGIEDLGEWTDSDTARRRLNEIGRECAGDERATRRLFGLPDDRILGLPE